MYEIHLTGFWFCCFKSCVLFREEEENYHALFGRILLLSCATLFGVLKESDGRDQVLFKMPDFWGENFPEVPLESSWITGLHEKD